MSDELDWELGELFDSGLFPFPVYELSAARRVVRYLMKRGVTDEELASAIQGSTLDLHAWLNRRGRRMFGEWAIAWLNESREAHRSLLLPSDRPPKVAHRYGGSINDFDSTASRDSSSPPHSDADSSDSDSDSDFRWSKEEPEVDRLSSSSSTVSGFSGGSDPRDFPCAAAAAGNRRSRGGDDVTMMTSESFTSVRSSDVTTRSALGSCLRGHVIDGSHLADSGNISDLSSAKSKNSFRKNVDRKSMTTVNDDVTTTDRDDVDRDVTSDVGGNCSCRLTHYIRCHHDSRHFIDWPSKNHL